MTASSQSRVEAGGGFVHLHVHSSYSLREGAMGISKLAKLAAADKMPALAITDTNNLFGALEFSEKLAKDGVQPIAGLQIALDFGDGAAMAPRGEESGAGRASIVLLACNEAGYLNLMFIASRAWLDPAAGETPHAVLERLQGRTAGLIALSGSIRGEVPHLLNIGQKEKARQSALEYLDIFGKNNLSD